MENISTIKKLIDVGHNKKIQNDTIHFKKVFESHDNKIIINYNGIFERYYEIIKDNCVLVKLTDDEYNKYRLRPKLLCHDLYNNVDLAPLMMRINCMKSVIDFDRQELYLFKSDINTILNEIMLLEESNINENRYNVEKEVGAYI